MTYKTILLIIGVNDQENDLAAAADLSAAARAHLSVLVVQLAAPPPVGDYAALSVAWLDERAEDMKQLDDAVRRARATLKDLGISFDANGIYCETAWADDDVGSRARYADVTLIGRACRPIRHCETVPLTGLSSIRRDQFCSQQVANRSPCVQKRSFSHGTPPLNRRERRGKQWS